MAGYFTENGYYPSYSELNNQAWVSQNMPALDISLLRDPLATNLTILSAPRAGQLAYQPVGEDPTAHATTKRLTFVAITA